MDITQRLVTNLSQRFPGRIFEAVEQTDAPENQKRWKLKMDNKIMKVEWSVDSQHKLLQIQQEQADKYLVGILINEVKQQIEKENL